MKILFLVFSCWLLVTTSFGEWIFDGEMITFFLVWLFFLIKVGGFGTILFLFGVLLGRVELLRLRLSLECCVESF